MKSDKQWHQCRNSGKAGNDRSGSLTGKRGREAGGQPGGLPIASASSMIWLMVDMSWGSGLGEDMRNRAGVRGEPVQSYFKQCLVAQFSPLGADPGAGERGGVERVSPPRDEGGEPGPS